MVISRRMLAACDFPAKLIFFADGEVYEVIHAASGKETLINHILSAPAETS